MDSSGSTPRAAGGGPDADPESVARQIALGRLASSPRTRAELAQTLAKRGVPVEAAARVLDRFEEVGLVDDAAFARAWVQSRHAGRSLARRVLAQELRRRGIADDVAKQAVDEIDPEDERAAAQRLLARKLRTTEGLDRRARMRRLVGMLTRKGYPPALAVQLVTEALAVEDQSA